ncbi:unannotated protein [freshwater metagenome]|uniref:Unannotated protein n=1 Tax=freshwater metagenome TaxID=449393 RepID=A0A6J7EC20_9ZZZZ
MVRSVNSMQAYRGRQDWLQSHAALDLGLDGQLRLKL